MEATKSDELTDRQRWLGLILVLVVSGVVGGLVRNAYFVTAPVHDDRVLQWQVGRVWTERSTRFEAAFVPYSGQICPLYFVYYEQVMRIFGIDSAAWHWTAHIAHTISAGLLYLWLAHYSRRWLGPMLAGILWGLVAIGRWDNPLNWNVACVIPWTVVFLLLAMLSLTKIHAPRSGRYAVLMGLCSVIMCLLWNVTWLFLPVLFVQYLLLERTKDRPVKNRMLWGIAGVGVPILIAVISLLIIRLANDSVMPAPTLEGLSSAFGRTGAVLGVTASDLFWSAQPGPYREIIQSVVAISATLTLLASDRRTRAIMLVLLSPAFCYLLVANFARQDLGLQVVLESGRYFYLPNLFWTASLGMIGGAWIRRWTGDDLYRARFVLMIALLLHAAHQHHIAQTTARQHRALWASAGKAFEDMRLTLDELADLGTAESPVVMPDIPIAVPPFHRHCYMLSIFDRITHETGRDGINIRRVDEMTEAEIAQARGMLRKLRADTAITWDQCIRDFSADLDAVRWLNEQAIAADRTLAIPEIRWDFGTLSVTIQDCVREGLSHPPDHLRFDGSASDREVLEEFLRQRPDPDGRRWRSWLDRNG